METKKISPSTMLRWAKTKSAFREQKNVKDAKKFSDLTPAKQKIIKSQYEKMVAKKKPAPKKERKKTYYIEAHMFGDDEVDMAESDGWKVYNMTGYQTFLKKSMTTKEAGMDMIWDNKESFADSSVSKMLKPSF